MTAFAIPAGYHPALAEDFTITVPVRVSNLMAEVTGIYVACMVGPGAQAFSAAERLGFGLTNATPDGSGDFSGNVEVKFNAATGKNPAAATHYQCHLGLTVGGAGNLPTPNNSNPALQPKPGAPFTASGSGALPQ